MKDLKAIKDLEENYLFIAIDFYNDGQEYGYLVFKKSEMTKEKIAQIFEDYNKKYNLDEYTDMFENYLVELGINYHYIKFETI